MSWQRIRGHERVVESFQRVVARGCISRQIDALVIVENLFAVREVKKVTWHADAPLVPIVHPKLAQFAAARRGCASPGRALSRSLIRVER